MGANAKQRYFMRLQEKAKEFISHGIHATDFRKKSGIILLLINLIVFVIALLLWHKIIFLSIVITVAVINIICTVIFYKKWNVTRGFLSQGTQFLLFCIALDLLCYGMYRCTNLFVWYEYLIFIVVQIVCAIVYIFLTVNYYKKFSSKKNKINIIAGSVAGLCCETGIIVCKIWLTDISLNVVIAIIALLIAIIIYLLLFCICLAFYRAYLIYKYDLPREISCYD